MATFHERLSAQDASFLLFERRGPPMHVGSVATFAPESDATPVDLARLRAYVESRLPALPHYRMRVAYTPMGHPVWVDDADFDLAAHVRSAALPAPGGEPELKALAGRLLSQRLDPRRPLWEMCLVEGLADGRFGLVLKVHHCMVDGVSGAGLLGVLLAPSPCDDFEPAPRWRARPAPGLAELGAEDVARRLAAPVSLARALQRAARHPEPALRALQSGAEAVWQALRDDFHPPARSPINRTIGTERCMDWRSLDLAAVKEVKKRLDGSVNDVVLAVVTGALRKVLLERRARLDDLAFRVAIPVNARDLPGETNGSNRVAALLLELPLAERFPVRRFRAIRDETRRLKASRAAEGIDLLTRFADWTGSDVLTDLGTRLVSALRPYHMIVTNVNGPPFPLHLLGARQEALYPQLPLFEGQGLGVAVMSYHGRIGVGLLADPHVMPDLARFADAIDAAFAELAAAAGVPGAAPLQLSRLGRRRAARAGSARRPR
jgi:WS/DGAT/MGAT family acyltransferase